MGVIIIVVISIFVVFPMLKVFFSNLEEKRELDRKNKQNKLTRSEYETRSVMEGHNYLLFLLVGFVVMLILMMLGL